MTKSCVLTSALLLMGANLPVHAGTTTIAAGGIYGGPNQHKAYCYVFNPSVARTFYILTAEIIRQDGADVTSGRTCQPGTHAPWLGILDPLKTCVISAEIESGSTYSCRLTISTKSIYGGGEGPKPNVRGTLDIRDGEEHVLTSLPLQ